MSAVTQPIIIMYLNSEEEILLEVPEVYKKLQPFIDQFLADPILATTNIEIACRALTPEEAIGSPGRNDFPLQKGKEKLMQAAIDGFSGQAYTDIPGDYEGTLKEALSLPPTNNYHRAVIIASLNALLRKLGRISNTIHCKDQGPKECSLKLIEKIKSEYGNPRIAVIGLQPAMIEQLSKNFNIRVYDLDPENIGQTKFGTKIESGDAQIDGIELWCDLVLATGSTVVNGTIDPILKMKKPVIFYGTTIASVADLLDLKRFCPCSN